MGTMHVVFTVTKGDAPDFKVFERRADAISFATKCVDDGADMSYVYEANASDARSAKAAVEMGEGRFLEARGRRATDTEIREWLWTSVL